jgi:hypothetical protein
LNFLPDELSDSSQQEDDPADEEKEKAIGFGRASVAYCLICQSPRPLPSNLSADDIAVTHIPRCKWRFVGLHSASSLFFISRASRRVWCFFCRL